MLVFDSFRIELPKLLLSAYFPASVERFNLQSRAQGAKGEVKGETKGEMKGEGVKGESKRERPLGWLGDGGNPAVAHDTGNRLRVRLLFLRQTNGSVSKTH